MNGARLNPPTRPVFARRAGSIALLALVSACASTESPPVSSSAAPAVTSDSPAQGRYKIGKPYQIKGIWYYPKVDYEYAETGVASWYGPGFHGQATANGEIYDMNEMTAAHKTLPLPSIVRVTNLSNGRSVTLRVNDRGPFVGERVIDVSRRAAQLLGFYGAGTTQVRVEVDAEESKRLAAALTGSSYPVAVGATALPATVFAPPADERTEPTVVADVERSAPAGGAIPSEGNGPTPPVIGETLAPVVLAQAVRPAPPAPAHAAPVQAAGISAPARFVQAGAFADANNAHRARAKLNDFGPVDMQPLTVAGRSVLRVRVGPLSSEQEARRVLAAAVQAGFPESRVVVE